MKIRNQAILEASLDALLEKLVDEFEMAWIKIHNTFDTKIDGERVLCETFCDFEYRQATLRWNLPMVAATTDEEIECTLIHELVHCLNAPVWSSLNASQQAKLEKMNELATENVALVIIRLRDLRSRKE